ncbi:glutamine synthetase family protein [Desulfurispora thermophila]|uniref:glutamine synthetase family protein n=1 Tax=Desulfurispora thermophila TaxID=265470 RepID=UPI00036E563D|nr:glutamine synthetase family protein [Desulfurispora thermophila]
MRFYTAEDVLEKVKENNVKFIRLQFTSMLGTLKNLAITVEDLPRALSGQVRFDSSVVLDRVGSYESDIYLMPDPGTFMIFPWRPREGAVARLLCDVLQPDGTPFFACSRSILKKCRQKAMAGGYQLQVGAEVEFYLFHQDEQGRPLTSTHDRAGYCDLTPVDRGENARRDMVLTLQEMGFDVATSHHEIGPGQHEIILKDDDVLAMADNLITFKFVVRTIAGRHGLHASFMPRPLNYANGSGLHLFLSLWRENANVLADPRGPRGLSSLAEQFIAGILHHAPALTALANPLVNSYKRLRCSPMVPCLTGCAEQLRAAMLRVPAGRGSDTRLLLRSPDPAGNPYLVLAAVLGCGLDGVEKGLVPQWLPEEDPAEKWEQLYREHCLPVDLAGALQALEGDRLLLDLLGQKLAGHYLQYKQEEWQRYQSTVHEWEINEYLVNY